MNTPQNYTITATIKVTFECSATDKQNAQSQFRKELAESQEGTDFRFDDYTITKTEIEIN
jgi:hypothetical protein